MIGVSLPFGWFTDGGDVEPTLALLKQHGVESVELRTVRPQHDPQAVLAAAKQLWQAGFQITVHGSVTAVDTAVEEVFAPLQALLPNLEQEKLNVTIHPVVGDNAALLVALSDYILEKKLPVTIALENNRRMPDKTQGDSAALVLEAVERANRSNVGICFDMGHYAYYVKKNHPDDPERMPGKAFFKRVIHTHIHAMKELRTHFPLGVYELPLDRYMDALANGYLGVYNLELDFPRIAPEWTPEEGIAQSLPYLAGKLRHCTRLYDQVRKEFDSWFSGALQCWQREGNSFGLIHSSSFLFHTNGCKWAMDVVFRNAKKLASTPSQVGTLMKDLQLMVLSHGHRDHYEESTLQALSRNDTLFLIPDFLEERTLGLGIPAEKLVIAKPGQPVTLFGITFLPFESPHFRPDGRGTLEYGYRVTAPGCPSMNFPVDIRDFSGRDTAQPADYCFANVWLNDNSADPAVWGSVVEDWAAYMLQFSTKHIFLAHLYENGRPDNRMWRTEHAQAVRDALLRQSPETRVTIPECGKVYQL